MSINSRECHEIVHILAKNPRTSAPKLADELALASGKQIHPEAVHCNLRKNCYNGRKQKAKPFISRTNEKKPFSLHVNIKTNDQICWDSIQFSDKVNSIFTA